jgi:hypothetical protein
VTPQYYRRSEFPVETTFAGSPKSGYDENAASTGSFAIIPPGSTIVIKTTMTLLTEAESYRK